MIEAVSGTMQQAMRSVAVVCLLIAATGAWCAENTGSSARTETRAAVLNEQTARLIRRLSDDNYAAREEASAQLVEIGDHALPALAKARESDDPEVAQRASAAEMMIRWSVSPELWSVVGGLIEEFERVDPTMRERIVRILRTVGGDEATDVLRQVLRRDPNRAVRRVAAMMLADLGSEGLAVLMEEGVEIAGLDPYDARVHVIIGNSFLEEGKYARAEGHYMKALELEADNYIAMYNMACVRSLQKRIDEAVEWLQKAVDAGYDEFEWMEQDADLDNIREDEGYKDILRKGPKPRKDPPGQPE